MTKDTALIRGGNSPSSGAASVAQGAVEMPDRYRHVARGTVYEHLLSAELQAATGAVEEGAILIVYRADDGKIWARRAIEFHDGRFERIPAAPEAPRALPPSPPEEEGAVAPDLSSRLRARAEAARQWSPVENREIYIPLTDVEEAARALAILKDPTAVHLNMLRGGIAKPSFVGFLHLYGAEYVEKWNRAEALAASPAPNPSAPQDHNKTAPEGWRLVPVTPSIEMLNAAIDVDAFKLGDISPLGFRCSPQQLFERCYAAMLSASPTPGAGGHSVVSETGMALGAFTIEVEKLLLSKLGRPWSSSGISIETLVDELANRSLSPTPGAGDGWRPIETAPKDGGGE